MRTVRCSGHSGVGGCLPRGVSAKGRCLVEGGGCPGCVYPACTGQGVCIPACTGQGVFAQRGCGRHLPGPKANISQKTRGRYPPSPRLMHAGIHTPLAQCRLGYTHLPPVNRITDRCKNITFPQLRLRTVRMNTSFLLHLFLKLMHMTLRMGTMCCFHNLSTTQECQYCQLRFLLCHSKLKRPTIKSANLKDNPNQKIKKTANVQEYIVRINATIDKLLKNFSLRLT